MADRARTPRQYRGQWCQDSVKKVFDIIFKRFFLMINSRYFFDRMYSDRFLTVLWPRIIMTKNGKKNI